MSTSAMIPMKWAASKTNDEKLRCVCCDREIKGVARFVEVIDGGSSVANPGLGPDTCDSGYMGFFPVGPGCAKKHFAGFTVSGE
jgi:hypothetical protein